MSEAVRGSIPVLVCFPRVAGTAPGACDVGMHVLACTGWRPLDELTECNHDSRMPHRTWFHEVTYDLSRFAAHLVAISLFRFRCGGRAFFPIEGGAIVCCNHQSFFDPVIVGLVCDRRLNYLARENLFHSRAFGALIRWYDAIPIQRDGLGLSGLKETLRRLKRGEFVLVFPEGTRTRDGQVQTLKPGICVLSPTRAGAAGSRRDRWRVFGLASPPQDSIPRPDLRKSVSQSSPATSRPCLTSNWSPFSTSASDLATKRRGVCCRLAQSAGRRTCFPVVFRFVGWTSYEESSALELSRYTCLR